MRGSGKGTDLVFNFHSGRFFRLTPTHTYNPLRLPAHFPPFVVRLQRRLRRRLYHHHHHHHSLLIHLEDKTSSEAVEKRRRRIFAVTHTQDSFRLPPVVETGDGFAVEGGGVWAGMRRRGQECSSDGGVGGGLIDARDGMAWGGRLRGDTRSPQSATPRINAIVIVFHSLQG